MQVEGKNQVLLSWLNSHQMMAELLPHLSCPYLIFHHCGATLGHLPVVEFFDG